MIDKVYQLGEALQALFREVNLTPDFDSRVMARLQASEQSEFAEQANRARQLEGERYRKALLEIHKVWRAKLRTLTVDGIGIACLIGVVLAAAWRHLDSHVERISDYYPYIAALLGVLIAAVPLVGMVAERDQRTADLT